MHNDDIQRMIYQTIQVMNENVYWSVLHKGNHHLKGVSDICQSEIIVYEFNFKSKININKNRLVNFIV